MTTDDEAWRQEVCTSKGKGGLGCVVLWLKDRLLSQLLFNDSHVLLSSKSSTSVQVGTSR